MAASINLAAADSTTSLLTCEPPTLFDAHLMSEDEMYLLEEPVDWGWGEERVRESESVPMGMCKS